MTKTPKAETPVEATERYRSNLQGEIDSAALYRALAENEKNPQIAEVYRRLAAVEEAHAAFWRTQIQRLGGRLPQLQAGWRTRMLIRLARWFGPTFVLPSIATLERADVTHYDAQPEASAGGLPAAERFYDRLGLVARAASLGGVESLASLPVHTSHHGLSDDALREAGVGPGMVRLSMGVEDAADLIADVERALGDG